MEDESQHLPVPKITQSKKAATPKNSVHSLNTKLCSFFLHNRLENQVLDTHCDHLKVQEISKRHHQYDIMITMYDTNCNHMNSWFNQFPYKTNNMSQNLKHELHVLKTPNPTKSQTWFEVSSKMIPKQSLYKIKNLSGDDSRYPPSPTKNALCQTLTC